MAPTDCRGLSAVSGFCRMIWARRRNARSGVGVTGSPPKRIMPASAWCRRSSSQPRVDLPQPDSPTRPSTSPGATESDTSFTAWIGPKRRDRCSASSSKPTGGVRGGSSGGRGQGIPAMASARWHRTRWRPCVSACGCSQPGAANGQRGRKLQPGRNGEGRAGRRESARAGGHRPGSASPRAGRAHRG